MGCCVLCCAMCCDDMLRCATLLLHTMGSYTVIYVMHVVFDVAVILTTLSRCCDATLLWCCGVVVMVLYVTVYMLYIGWAMLHCVDHALCGV